MADYIKKQDVIVYFLKQADAAYQEFEIYGGEAGIEAETLHSVADELVDFPTAEVAPVRHGRWEGYSHSIYCGIDADGEPVYRDGVVYYCSNPKCRRKTVIKENYCPNCGARMDGEENALD